MTPNSQDRSQEDPAGPRQSCDTGGSRRLWSDPWLWIIVALALGLGLVSSSRFFHEATPRGQTDDLHYHQLAKALLENGQFEGTYRAPGYPGFVALVYAVFGPHPFAVYAAQSLLFAASVAMAAALFGWVTARRAVALMVAAMIACYPFFYRDVVPSLLTEGLTLFLVVLFLLGLARTTAKPVWWKSMALGLVFAAATLTKAVLLPFAGVAAICLLALTRERRCGLRQALVYLATVAVCIAPWTWRNWHVTGAFLPISTGGGFNFWFGNCPGNFDSRLSASNRSKTWPYMPLDLETAIQGMTEVQRDSYLKRLTLDEMRRNPGLALKNFCHKFSVLWLGNVGADPSTYAAGTRPLLTLGRFTVPKKSLLNCPIFALGLMGIWMLTPSQRRRALPVLLLLGWFTFIYVIIIAEFRYVTPVFPCLLGFAAIPMVQLVSAFRRRWATKCLSC